MSRKHTLYDVPLPDGWELVTVDDLKAREPHSCVAGPFGSSISSRYFVLEGVPVIRGSNLRDDLTPFIPKGFVYVSEEQAKKYKAQHVTAGDLVFTCWGTVGQVGLIPGNGPFKEYIISNKQLKLRPDIKKAIPRFLFYYFAGPEMVKHILNRAIGAAVPGINLGILKSLEVALPPLPTQRKIVAILSAYDDLIENNLRRIKILEEMAQNLYRECSRATLGVISINTTEACTNQGFITCIPNERFPLYTLYYWLKENVEYFISLGTGATFKEITKGVFKTIELVVPEKSIVTQFEDTVQQFAFQVLNLQRKNTTLRRTRDLLLPKLISGQVDVSELDITIPEEAEA